jgi:hypothetical protein
MIETLHASSRFQETDNPLLLESVGSKHFRAVLIPESLLFDTMHHGFSRAGNSLDHIIAFSFARIF